MRRISLRHVFVSLFLFLCFAPIHAQELKCNVMINYAQITGTNKQVFETFKKSVDDFMNQRQWTSLPYAQNEKIDCSLSIQVKQYENNTMSCEFTVQSLRPIFGTSYKTTILNLRDREVTFSYNEYDQLELNASYDNNLTAVLAYYAYLIIGFDLDTYERLGGTAMFQNAENIVSLSQSRSGSEGDGWKAFTSNTNRYAIVNCLMSERYRAMREYAYTYHRLALDDMATNTAKARARIAEDLKVVRESNKLDPSNAMVTIFINAKSDELVSIFKKGTPEEKNTVYDHLTAINPTRSNDYNQIKQ